MIIDEEKWESYVKALRAWYEGADIQVKDRYNEWIEYKSFGKVPAFDNHAWRVKLKTKTLRYMNVLCIPNGGRTWVDIVNSPEELEDLKRFCKVEKLSDWQTVEVEYN